VVLIARVGVHVFEEFFLRRTMEKLPAKYALLLPGAKPPKPITD
jgi:hypothetical protein